MTLEEVCEKYGDTVLGFAHYQHPDAYFCCDAPYGEADGSCVFIFGEHRKAAFFKDSYELGVSPDAVQHVWSAISVKRQLPDARVETLYDSDADETYRQLLGRK